jgi:AraC family transcriptional regulator
MLEPHIVQKPALTVVGLEASFLHALSPQSTAAQVIGPLWDRFCHRAHEVPNRIGETMYGIIYGRPENERAHPHELQYIAAVAVDSTGDIPQGMVHWTVPAGTFAVFTHRGPIADIAKTVTKIYRVWLPQSNYDHAEMADVELYDHRFHCDRDDSEMEYWISVKPKVLLA